MTRTGRVIAALLLLLPFADTAQAQYEARPLTLVTTYADGRVTRSAVGPRGHRAWTPVFPRIANWREARGVSPVTALHVTASLVGESLRVSVSVLRGPAHDVEETIASVVVGLDTEVVVADLRRVGLLPVTFSAALYATPVLPVPRGDSHVEGLEIEGIEPTTAPTPGYAITLRNRTDVAAVTVAVDSYIGGRAALSVNQGEPAAQPVVSPGGTFTFHLRLAGASGSSGGVATAAPLDGVVLTGVIWADGRLGGNRLRMAPALALHLGRMSAVEHVITVLRRSRSESDPPAALSRVRDAMASAPITPDAAALATVLTLVPGVPPSDEEGVNTAVAIGKRDVRDRLIADIDRLRPSVTPAQARQWLDEALPACEDWLRRLRAMFPQP